MVGISSLEGRSSTCPFVDQHKVKVHLIVVVCIIGMLTSELKQVIEDQVTRATLYSWKDTSPKATEECARRAQKISAEFLESLPLLRSILADDVDASLRGDPAAKSAEEIILCYPGMHLSFLKRRLGSLVCVCNINFLMHSLPCAPCRPPNAHAAPDAGRFEGETFYVGQAKQAQKNMPGNHGLRGMKRNTGFRWLLCAYVPNLTMCTWCTWCTWSQDVVFTFHPCPRVQAVLGRGSLCDQFVGNGNNQAEPYVRHSIIKSSSLP